MKYKIPFIKPRFPSADEVSKDFSDIVASNWYTNFGPYERKLRDVVSAYVGQGAHVVTVANATLGIELAILALLPSRESDRKEVLVQSFTFAAGPEALVRCGFTPVFMDVTKDLWQADVDQAKQYIESNKDKVAGILFCNTFGVGNPSIDDWEALASEYGLPLIIDTAAGFGSEYLGGEKVGLRGDCEIFSLHATKPFCVGEGGLITTRNASLAGKLMQLENFGFNDSHDIVSIGTNAKLQELNCAIGLRQLEVLDGRLQARRGKLVRLKELLGDGFLFQENDSHSSIPFASTLVANKEVRDGAIVELNNNGIEVKTYYAPLHEQVALFSYCKIAGVLSVTEHIASRIISLPLYETMTDDELRFIAETLLHATAKQNLLP